MASTFNAALGAAAAILFWTLLGLAITRRLVPALALPMAPVVGWAVHSAISLPVFLILPFSTTGVIAVAGLILIAAVAASRATGRSDPGAGAPTVPAWAYILAALLAAAPAAAVLPKVAGDAVNLAVPIFDHAKVALIDDMMKFGLPPGNPFFADGDHPRFAYYYLWHFSAAELALATHISGWEAAVAMTWVSAATSLVLMMGLAAWIGGRMAAILVVLLSVAASVRPVLWWTFGAANVDAVVGRAAGFAGWLFQSAWVPQHIMAASCVVAAVVTMAGLAARRSALAIATLALLVAAGFESSTFVGGITFAVAGPVAALVLLRGAAPKQRWRFIAALVIAAVLAGCLVTPLLRDQLAAMAGRGAGTPVALAFYPVLGVAEPLRTILDPPAFWVVLLPIELSAAYLIGMIALVRFCVSGEPNGECKSVVAGLAALALASLAVSWLLASTLADSNDLGWRALLPAAVVLTAFAAAGVARWIAARSSIAIAAAAAAILLGLPTGIDLIHGDVMGRIVPASRLFAQSPQMWEAVRRHAAPDERIGNNPLFLQEMTLWPVDISWALLADRRSCYAGRELVLVYSSLAPRRTEEIEAQFLRVFAGEGSPDDVADLAKRYDCRVIVVTATDGAWSRDPFATSPLYRLVDESAARWRIYRAKVGE